MYLEFIGNSYNRYWYESIGQEFLEASLSIGHIVFVLMRRKYSIIHNQYVSSLYLLYSPNQEKARCLKDRKFFPNRILDARILNRNSILILSRN